jgi:RND family efflux transporter MFP subunit
MKIRFHLAVTLVAALLPGSIGWAQGVPTPAVVMALPLAKHIVQWDEYTGRFEAVQRVEVRPRVTGYLQSIHFVDGAQVQKGDLLFSIDPRPYEIAVQQARADVIRTQAEVARSSLDYARAEQLVKSATTTVRELDQRKANFDTARAQEMSAEAALRNAELNLEWCSVAAPVDGRISDRKVDVGNLVVGEGNATLLTTIVSQHPIHFVFDAAEADYIRYVRMSRAGQRPSSRDTANPVEVKLADEQAWLHKGRMDFVDNEVNAHTGTIRGRAVFDNQDGFFVPGTFGRLRLFGGFADVLLVPDAAVVSDQAEKIVFTVGADNIVAARPVTLGGLVYGLRAVMAGLSAQDRVIVEGLANPFVRPGAPVRPTNSVIVAAADEEAQSPPDPARRPPP